MLYHHCLHDSDAVRNEAPVVYPEMTVVVSATSRSVVLINGGVIFLVMRLFSFEHSLVCCHADLSMF